MLLLTSTSDLIQLVSSATADIEVHASWVDNNAGVITLGRTNTASITTATTTTVVGSPGSGVQRNVRLLNIRNNHGSTTCDVTVRHTDGTTTEDLMKVSLLTSEALVFDESGVWTHYKSDGSEYPKVGMPIATQSELETGAALDRQVTAGGQHFHPSAAKFFADINGAGTLSASSFLNIYNLSSVTDTGAGRATFNYSTSFSSANYACVASPIRSATSLTVTNLKYVNIRNATQAAGSIQIECYDGTATTAAQEDPGSYFVAAFGDR